MIEMASYNLVHICWFDQTTFYENAQKFFVFKICHYAAYHEHRCVQAKGGLKLFAQNSNVGKLVEQHETKQK